MRAKIRCHLRGLWRWMNSGLSRLILVSFLTACAPTLPPPPMSPPDIPPPPPERPLSSGSLWRDGGLLSDLYGDHRARKVGDLVTVKIVENAEALKSATTQTSRDSSLSASISSLFGAPLNFHGFKPEASGSFKNEFEGSGVTKRKDTLVATLTARVVEVLPGGQMRIEGYKDVTINNERQYILLRGIIRPEDISPENVVLSTDIAEAQVAYSGYGVVSEKQRPGWLSRALDYVWPF